MSVAQHKINWNGSYQFGLSTDGIPRPRNDGPSTIGMEGSEEYLFGTFGWIYINVNGTVKFAPDQFDRILRVCQIKSLNEAVEIS